MPIRGVYCAQISKNENYLFRDKGKHLDKWLFVIYDLMLIKKLL